MIITEKEKKKIYMWIYITFILSALISFVSLATQLYSLLVVTCGFVGMCFVLCIIIAMSDHDRKKFKKIFDIYEKEEKSKMMTKKSKENKTLGLRDYLTSL